MNVCELRNLNQGTPDCDFEIGVMDYLMLTMSAEASISVTDKKRLFDHLREMSLHADPLQRFYPIPFKTGQVEDNSTEASMGSLDKSPERKLGEGRFKYRLKYESFIYRDRNLQKLDGFRGGAFFINTKRLFVGGRNIDGSISALPVEIYSDGGGPSSSGSDIKTMDLLVDFGEKSMFINQVTAVKLRDNDRINTLKGFRDLEILVLSVAGNIATVQLVASDVNVYDQYSAVFSDAKNWRVDGMEASAVALDAAQKAFKVTVAGGYEINVAPVDVLKTANVIGFEGVPSVLHV